MMDLIKAGRRASVQVLRLLQTIEMEACRLPSKTRCAGGNPLAGR